MAFVTFKIQFEDDLRRIAFDAKPSFEEVRKLISGLYVSRSLPTDFAIKYTDSDGDLVTIGSDIELWSAIPSTPSPTVRLAICKPSLPEPRQQQPRPQQPAPVDFSQIFNLLGGMGGGFGAAQAQQPQPPIDLSQAFNLFAGMTGAPPAGSQPQPQPQPLNLAPLMNIAMNAFAQFQPQQPQQPNQQPFDISSLLNTMMSGLNGSQQPQASSTTNSPSTGPASPFTGLFEGFLERNQDLQNIVGEQTQKMMEACMKVNENGEKEFPSQEEVTNLAKEHFLSLFASPELQGCCPWVTSFFQPEQIRGILDSLVASPIAQRIITRAYNSSLEAAKKMKEEKEKQSEVKEEEKMEVEEKKVEQAPVESIEVEYSDLEKECLAELSAMGFTDSKTNVHLLRQANFDLWETIQLILQDKE